MNTFLPLRVTLTALLILSVVSCGSEQNSEATSESKPAAEPAPNPAAGPTEVSETQSSLQEKVNGLWLYTGLRTGDGTDMPLTGIFLFKDDVFLQQAVFNSEPFEQARSMAHAGPYRPEPATGSVHLVAQQTISIDPTGETPLSFRANTDHDVTVSRKGDDLTLIFGMGTSTVQEFYYIGPGDGELYSLANGALALVDGHFILVDGNNESVTSGYGRYEQDGEAMTLNIIRWSESNGDTHSNLRDTQLKATFDGSALVLEDGRTFGIVSGG